MLKTIGYMSHLAFEIIIVRMEMRHLVARVDSARTVMVDMMKRAHEEFGDILSNS